MDRQRSLYTAENSQIVGAMTELANQIFPESAAISIFPLGASLCRPCQSSVKKLVSLRSELPIKEEEARQKVKQAGLACGLAVGQQSED